MDSKIFLKSPRCAQASWEINPSGPSWAFPGWHIPVIAPWWQQWCSKPPQLTFLDLKKHHKTKSLNHISDSNVCFLHQIRSLNSFYCHFMLHSCYSHHPDACNVQFLPFLGKCVPEKYLPQTNKLTNQRSPHSPCCGTLCLSVHFLVDLQHNSFKSFKSQTVSFDTKKHN